jgi:hypothetical protein
MMIVFTGSPYANDMNAFSSATRLSLSCGSVAQFAIPVAMIVNPARLSAVLAAES